MASVVDLCNSGLNLLGASTITALTDDSKNARLCNQRYEPIRNRIFRSHAWNCLTKRVQLAEDSDAPVVEYANQFTLPSDCLRVLKVHNGTTDSIQDEIDYAVEGRKIKTNEGTVYLVYIALITDPNEYDSYLQEAISAALAADIAYAVTNNATLAKNYQTTADERLREARFIDSTENALGTIESNEFTDARL
mgnify:CR=1 FL=1|tara:strand:+ start:325 stop:903 length:579 start_codon:yes stop_codon:yes gene_type:complete